MKLSGDRNSSLLLSKINLLLTAQKTVWSVKFMHFEAKREVIIRRLVEKCEFCKLLRTWAEVFSQSGEPCWLPSILTVLSVILCQERVHWLTTSCTARTLYLFYAPPLTSLTVKKRERNNKAERVCFLCSSFVFWSCADRGHGECFHKAFRRSTLI